MYIIFYFLSLMKYPSHTERDLYTQHWDVTNNKERQKRNI